MFRLADLTRVVGRIRSPFLNCAAAVLSLGLLLAFTSCGGGSSTGGGPPPPPPPPDFALSATSNTATVPPGGAVLIQVSVTAQNGFASPVTVDFTGVPTGTMVSPTTPFTMSPGSQTVTVILSSSVALGNLAIGVQASSGSLKHTADVALLVQQQPFDSFSVTLNNSELSMAQGGSTSTIVGLSLTSSGGSPNYAVQFSVTGLPSGVQATFGTNPLIMGQPATGLTLTASTNAGLANYATVTVVGTRAADGNQQSATFLLNVTPLVGTLPPIRTDFLRTDGTPTAAVYDSAHSLVYASNPLWNRVDVISPATHQIVNIIPAPYPTGMDMSLDGRHLVVGSNLQQIVTIDTATQQVVKRTSVPPFIQGGASYGIPALIANTSNGKALVGMTLNSSPPAYFLEQWDPVAGTFTPLSAPGVTVYIDQLVRTGDGTKALVVDYGTEVDMAIYDAASDSFSVSGQSPVGQVLGVVGSPTAHQFAVVGTTGFAFVDSNLNTLATPPLGGIFWGMQYSPDGTKLYVTMALSFSICGPSYPVILTYDTSSFTLAGVAPAFQTQRGSTCVPYTQASPLTADNTGILYSSYSHGLVLDDAANYQNLLTLPGGPPFPSLGFADEVALNTPLATDLGQIAYDVLPDVWFGNSRGTNIQFADPLVNVTAPSSPNAGLVNVKTVLPDGWFSLAPQVFSYGSKILFISGSAGSPQGGATLTVIGYGLIGNNAATTVTIGGQVAAVVAASKYVDINDSAGYPFSDVDEVQVVVPPGVPGVADVTVTSGAGTATLPAAFTYLSSVSDYSSSDTFTFALYDPQRHWLYLTAGDHVDVFAADTQQFLSPIVPPTISGTRQLRGLALTPDNSKLLVANFSDLSLAIINPDNPSSATAVQVIPSIQSGYPGPYAVAATSTGKAFVTTGGCGSPPVDVVDLSTLQVTTPFNSIFICGGTTLWSTGAGDHVLMDGSLWSATTNHWTLGMFAGINDGASRDGYWYSNAYTRLDVQGIERTQGQVPDFFYTLPGIDNSVLTGEKMTASGSVLYAPSGSGVDITDTNHGNWLGRIILAEHIDPLTQSPMDFDESGNRLFLITDKGLTVAQLASLPLSIGYLNPASGTTAGGTAVTIRGSGFQPGATVSIGGAAAITAFVDGATLHVTTPAHAAGGARVAVQNPDGTSYSLDDGFDYQ